MRVIAATNKNLHTEQAEGRFREDLYYRLNVVSISLPALKDRKSDVPELVEHLLATRYAGRQLRIQPQALRALERYDWPGNVRELVNVLERAQILAENHEITLDDLPESLQPTTVSTDDAPADTLNLDVLERRAVAAALTRSQGVKSQAAQVLGVSRRALYRLIEKHGLMTAEQSPNEGPTAVESSSIDHG